MQTYSPTSRFSRQILQITCGAYMDAGHHASYLFVEPSLIGFLFRLSPQWNNCPGRCPGLTYQHNHYKIKHSCAVVCWIGPWGRCREDRYQKKRKTKALLLVETKETKQRERGLLAVSDCLLGSSWKWC